MKIIAIIQARTASTRLPRKVLRNILNKPLLWHVYKRVAHSKLIDKTVIATSNLPSDNKIVALCKKYKMPCYVGNESDVLDRYYQTALKYKGDIIIRVTSDCPFVDPYLIDETIKKYNLQKVDYMRIRSGAAALYDKVRLPEGLATEVISFKALKKAWQEAKKSLDREHVSSYIWSNPNKFKIGAWNPSKKDYSFLRITVDYKEDLKLTRIIYKKLYKLNHLFTWQDVVKFLEQHPEVAKINQHIIGKEKHAKIWRS